MTNNQQATNNGQQAAIGSPSPPSTRQLSVWKGTWALIQYRPGMFWLSVSMAVIVFTTNGAIGWLQKLFFDRLTGDAPVQFDLWLILAALVAIEASRMGLNVLGGWSATRVRLAGQALLRKNVVQNILQKPGAQPLPATIGDAINRLDHDLADFGDFPTWLPEIIGHGSFTIFALIVMFSIEPRITAVAMLPLAAVFFLNRVAWERFLRYHKESRDSDSVVTGFLGEIFGAIQALKVADAETATMRYLQTLNDRRRKFNVRHGIFYALFNSVSDNMGDVAVAVMVIMAGVSMSKGNFTVGDFALFSSYLFFVARFPATIGSYLSEIAQQRVVLDRAQALHPYAAPESLVAHGPIYEESHRRDAEVLWMEVTEKTAVHHLETLEISGLTYQYPYSVNRKPSPDEGIRNTEYGLRPGIFDISLTIPRGSFTVITGRIGSGKTTLLRVLLGLLPLDGGEIRWNGKVVADPAAFFVPPRSAYTPQVPRLFSETLRDNILFGLPQDEVGLMGAVETAVLTPDLAQLENGLDTVVGPRGVRLSGGQVQRAAAARMLVRNAELLVFDDLSSALDVETEKLLWERVSVIGKQLSVNGKQNTDHRLPITDYRPTILAVSHRREALRRADQIVVMENGRIAAQGSLTELLTHSPEMQAIWQAEKLTAKS